MDVATTIKTAAPLILMEEVIHHHQAVAAVVEVFHDLRRINK